ncbi:MAG: molybdopterin-dependent oxidoreductase [Deltaproteobacteria bacterium]|nr:molybdopterin-dependent oxidoreductase [Deltaproteobacteria bacterium]
MSPISYPKNPNSSKNGKIYRSACRMCHGGCSALVHVNNSKVVKIKGDPEFPLNRGKLCVKGMASIDQLYNPNRLKHPLKRVGQRGEGKWKQISWDEALDAIVNKIQEIKEEFGVESIAIGQGTGRHHYRHVVRFAHALGTPNWCEPGAAQCFHPRINAGGITYGDLPICDYYGDVNPACLLVWGHNPLVTGPDGETQFKVRDCIKRGTKLIVVDPRETETAKKADIWLQIRPGTDDALALSMIHVITQEGIYDRDFVNEWTVGFDQLAERVRSCTPEWAEKITWIPADKIKESARLFANTRPASVEWGVAIEHTPNCFQTVRAVALLPGITGNIDIPGGWILGMRVIDDIPILLDNLTDEMKEKRLGADRYKLLSGRNAPFPSAHIPTLMKAIRTGKPYPVKAFLNFGNNTLATYANAKQAYETLLRLDFLSVMDLYMTPTAELADIVLPAASWLEVDEVVGLPFRSYNFALIQQKVIQIGECRQDEEVLIDLARRLNLAVGIESLEDLYNTQLKKLGITFDELKEKGFLSVPMRYRKFEERGFNTPSGKVELYSSIMEKYGYDPLPYYQEPPESPLSTPELAQDYPLILTTGGRTPYYFHSEYRQIPSLREKHPAPLVEINPRTADELDIRDGEWVWIQTVRGRIKQRARLAKGIHPRVVHIEHGWWFPEEPGPEHGIWNSNANILTNNAPPYDPAMGTYQLRALLCKIYKVDG